MKKIIIFLTILLTGCAKINNPYDAISPHQLSKISSGELCTSLNDNRYKLSANVLKEMVRRGYRDCSESEVFCIEHLGLTPATPLYVNCRMQRDQYELNVAQLQQERYYHNMMLSKASEPVDVYVHHYY